MIPRLLLTASVLGLAACQLPQAGPPGSEVRRALIPEAEIVSSRHMSSLNDTARYMAGMAGAMGSPLTSARQTAHWQRYSRNMDELWRRFSVSKQPRISRFSQSELGPLRNTATVWYPFSGPDFVFANAFFTGASNYILCGLEGSEMLPEMASLSSAQLDAGLDGIYTSLTSALSYSFFITKDMRVDLQRTRFRGTLPLVLVFAARLGYDIQSVEQISLDAAGNPLSGLNKSCPGYAVRCTTGFGRTRTIYYFTEDVSNSSLAGDPRYLNFIKRFGTVVTYLKSASYLMHTEEFSTIRNAILRQSRAVLEDDSGIPLRSFGEEWDLTFYGKYAGTLDIFKGYYQPGLAEIYKTGGPAVRTIDFGLGYMFQSGQSAQILARKR